MVWLPMSENAKPGTAPSGVGQCTDCGAVYPIRRYAGAWHAVGTDGTCRCGGAEFTLLGSG